jgi:hypothetical protein
LKKSGKHPVATTELAQLVFDYWKRSLFFTLSASPEFLFTKINHAEALEEVNVELNRLQRVRKKIESLAKALEFDPSKPLWVDIFDDSKFYSLKSADPSLAKYVLDAYEFNENQIVDSEAILSINKSKAHRHTGKPKRGPGRSVYLALAKEILVVLFALDELGTGMKMLRDFLEEDGEFSKWHVETSSRKFYGFNHAKSESIDRWRSGLRERMIETIISRGSVKILRINAAPVKAAQVVQQAKERAREVIGRVAGLDLTKQRA